LKGKAWECAAEKADFRADLGNPKRAPAVFFFIVYVVWLRFGEGRRSSRSDGRVAVAVGWQASSIRRGQYIGRQVYERTWKIRSRARIMVLSDLLLLRLVSSSRVVLPCAFVVVQDVLLMIDTKPHFVSRLHISTVPVIARNETDSKSKKQTFFLFRIHSSIEPYSST